MFLFHILFIYIFSFTLKNIKSRKEEIKLWDIKVQEKENPTGNEDSEILSHSFEEKTGAELYFIKNKNTYKFFLKEANQNITINYKESIEIEIISPLFQFNSNFYFCSSLQGLMYINRDEYKIKDLNNSNPVLKCLRGPGENTIIVAFIETESLILYDTSKEDYRNYIKTEGNYIAINYYHENQIDYEITVLSKNKQGSNYRFCNIKEANPPVEFNIREHEMELFSRVELTTLKNNGVISFVFTYEPNTEKFHIYRVNLEIQEYFYEFRFFHSFNNFNINFAKYLADNTILYYSITSAVPDNNQNYISYIGAIDIEYNFGLFNMKSNYKGKIYFNNDTFNREYKLIYFINNTENYFCPFVNEKDKGKCTFDKENNKFVVSRNDNGSYYNYFNFQNCPENFIEFGNYCFEDCTDGFSKEENSCKFCPVDGRNHIFFYISRECKSPDKCNPDYIKESDITTCYDCETGDKIYYDHDCIDDCAEIFGEEKSKNECIKCEDKDPKIKYYFSLKEKKCTLCNKGVKDNKKNICTECKYNDQKKLYLQEFNICVENCENYYTFEEEGICLFCEDKNNSYYQDKDGDIRCVSECDNDNGYGIDGIILDDLNKSLNLCVRCMDNKTKSNNVFLQDKECVKTCGEKGKFKKWGSNNKCLDCGDGFFFEYTQDCIEECPNITKKYDNDTCEFCPKEQIFSNGKCLQNCEYNQTKLNISLYNEIFEYCLDIKCDKNQKIINGECFNCTGQYYSPLEHSCYKCFCWSENNTDYHCNDATGQCNCSPKYYGYSCEFYIVEGNETMKIITLNNRLIKSSKNYFTYNLKDNTILSDEYSFRWEVFFDNNNISDNENYKKFFTTASNEKIFGINKEIFDEKGNNTIYISLNICKKEEIIYYSKIRLNIIELIEGISNFEPKYNDIIFNEMETRLKIKLIDEKEKYQGRYEFQYGLVDENNERLPLTSYIESDQIDLNLICPINFDVNIRNDREEEKNYRMQKVTSCNPSDFFIDDILNKDYYLSEEIFLLKSYLKSKKNQGPNEVDNIINFINDTINETINENGSYIEPIHNSSHKETYTRNLLESDLKTTNLNITYSEPKNIFSLINYLLTYRKKQINKEYVLSIFNSFSLLFEKVFKNGIISDKALSDNDIKSLFRTIDNLYDVIIERNINNTQENSFYGNFIEVLENISRYLSFKTYPSETIRLIGKRISLLTYNLGVHQNNNNISFPYIKKNNTFYINNFSNYSFDNYDINQKLCSQKDPALFCFTKKNYNNFIQKLKDSYENLNLNNLTLNIFLLEEIKKNTKDVPLTDDGPDGEKEYQRIILKYNYTAIFRLMNRTENFTHIINNNNILIEFDLELPFFNFAENQKVEEESNNYLTKNGYDIPLYPDYRDFTCLPKSYYDNDTYYCFTHFDFKRNSTRCNCTAKLNDEIIIIENSTIANYIKEMQFPKTNFTLYNTYGLVFIYIFILLLLIPTIYYLLSDIIKDSKDLKKNNIIDFEVDRKTKYNEIKKYSNTGIFVFSLYLTLRKFPYFSPFNKYNKRYPRFIKHLIIIMGLLIGFIISLLPYIFIPFTERNIFKNQRSLEYSDNAIREIVPEKYYWISVIFSIFGYIFTNLFIYIFSKILNFEQEEIDIWLDIKTMCKDYIYYEIKSEVLLGPIWNKIKSRMMAYYYICGEYYLKRRQNNKFSNYLDQISRIQIGRKTVMPELSGMGQILPKTTNSSEIANVLDINNNSNSNEKNNKSVEMIHKDVNEPLLDKEGNKHKESILTNLNLNNNKIIGNNDTQGLKIRRTDNFSLDNTFISDEKTKRQVEHFTKVRNKYIYINKRKEVDEKEIDDKSNDGDENTVFNISPQINYVYFPSDSINSQGNNMASKGESKDISNFILISIILLVIFYLLLLFIIRFIKKMLDNFDEFIIKAWIFPIIIFLTVVSFLLYYIKIFIGSFLLFHFYHWRKKGRLCRILYLIFVDQSMIYVYKVRNLLTKYKKEFDYL